MKNLVIGMGVVVLTGLGCGRQPASVPTAEVPPMADASVEIPLLQGAGETLVLDSLRGKVVLIDFCATWSAPSRAGIADLNGLQAAWPRSDLMVLGLCIDEGELAEVSQRVAELGAEYTVGWADPKIQKRFGGIRPIPTRIVLDRDGNEVARFEGAVPVARLEAALRPLLKPAPSPRS